MELFTEKKSRGRRRFYVFPLNAKVNDAIREAARKQKASKNKFKTIPVYVKRDVGGLDLLYLEKVPGSKMMLGVVKR